MAKIGARPRIEWETGIPLLTNPFLLGDMAKTLGIAWVALVGLVAAILASDDFDGFEGALKVVTLCVAFVFVLLSAVCLAIFRNRFGARFTLDDDGVLYESGRVGRGLSAASAIIGILSGRPGPAGAGILAATQNAVRMEWKDVRKVASFPRWRVITLSNGWRPVLRLYCGTEEIYGPVRALVEERVVAQGGSLTRHGRTAGQAGGAPPPTSSGPEPGA